MGSAPPGASHVGSTSMASTVNATVNGPPMVLLTPPSSPNCLSRLPRGVRGGRLVLGAAVVVGAVVVGGVTEVVAAALVVVTAEDVAAATDSPEPPPQAARAAQQAVA